MCIRDSQQGALLVQIKSFVGFGNLDGEQAHLAGLAQQFDGCLLYTSDAADERSSVDLGGRRIIKKKNKRAIHKTDKQGFDYTRHKY